MKRFLVITALALVTTVSAFAQVSSLLRPRIEIAESSSEDNSRIEVFYMNDETPRMYYLSLGNLGVGTDILQVSADPVYELFIPLGNTLDEVIAKMEEIKSFYKLPRLETREISGCFAIACPNDNLLTVTITSRKLLASKILEFSLPTDASGIVRATHIYKSNFGSLLTGVKIYKKIHPKQ
jgi:hypothetical protein